MACRFSLFFIVHLAVLLLLAAIIGAYDSGDKSGYLNVYGEFLEPCSSDGMALTGYTRSGYCVGLNEDSESHHICIDLSSLGQGDDNDNDNIQTFCDVTRQDDWCGAQDMPCHEDRYANECSVMNWCVGQGAFASYIEGSGGCDNIQNIVCESINQEALVAYREQSNSDLIYQDALDCVLDRCGLASSTRVPSTTGGALEVIIFFALIMVVVLYRIKVARANSLLSEARTSDRAE